MRPQNMDGNKSKVWNKYEITLTSNMWVLMLQISVM